MPEQTISTHYMTEMNLQRLLEKLFPGQKDFNIRMRNDVLRFDAPKVVDESEFM
ncbi:hypothetical protein S40288_10793 [Stachybotrys chartarum IBT 40288]|nr:hypothetical protein S40288_10793 [Stachybotrys chartarum IBT 40288]